MSAFYNAPSGNSGGEADSGKSLRWSQQWKLIMCSRLPNNLPRRPDRRRLQLRAEKGEIQTHEEEFRDILEYFRRLYHGPTPSDD